MDGIKIIITGKDIDKCLRLAFKLTEINDNLSITPKFSSNLEYEGLNKTLDFHMDLTTIYLAYKNNALLYVNTENNISTGITIDDFLNNNISVIDIKNFNMIADKSFEETNILVIWLDSKSNNKYDNIFEEIKYLQDRLQELKYMYFYEESIDNIANTIIQYLDGPEELKIELLENNS